MTIQHKLVGDAMQTVICQLGPDQAVYCEAGKFLWKTTNVSMETRLGKDPRPGGSRATLEGDGTVILQSMTYDGMANALRNRLGGDDRRGLTGGLLGGGND